jgi:putative ABC transport system ATP-binding protein
MGAALKPDQERHPPFAEDSVLQLLNVSKSFGSGPVRIDALVNVSVGVRPGELVVLLGPSGAGKTTLIHIAAGLERPSTGSVRLGGEDLSTLDDEHLSRLRRSKVGLVFQAYHLIDYLDAESNVALPLRFGGVRPGEAAARAREALSRLGLARRVHHHPSELSGGEMQRVAIARALVIRPAIVLADEPTGNLDSCTGADVFRVLADLNQHERVAVLLATHDERAVADASYVIELRDGRLATDPRRLRSGTSCD